MSFRTRIAAGCVGLALGVAWAPHACAQDPSFGWDPRWPKFQPYEYVLTGVAGTASLLLYVGVPDARTPSYQGGILFDDYFRDVLRLRSPRQRDAARRVSDLMVASTLTWLIAVDSLTVPLARGSAELSGQMLLMDAEALAFSSLLNTVLFKAFARARPTYTECQQHPNHDPQCDLHPTGSFPSGHTNTSFTAAGLSCAHHLHVALYGDRLADVLACAGTITLAAAAGTLRVVGDRHYATDVVVAAALGFAMGYGMPTLLHYGKVQNEGAPGAMQQPLGQVVPLGPVISGSF
jgi:membrane-associated phospholipid phosphatase